MIEFGPNFITDGPFYKFHELVYQPQGYVVCNKVHVC